MTSPEAQYRRMTDDFPSRLSVVEVQTLHTLEQNRQNAVEILAINDQMSGIIREMAENRRVTEVALIENTIAVRSMTEAVSTMGTATNKNTGDIAKFKTMMATVSKIASWAIVVIGGLWTLVEYFGVFK